MNAIRRDEDLDNLHSLYVDQWDWEKVIEKKDRTTETLRSTVETIYSVFKDTEQFIHKLYPAITPILPEKITFITSQDLEDRYPELTPKEREDAVAKEYGAVFISQIGKILKSGEKHDGRSPDYDDWNLNGDILFWYPVLDRAVELSSMGIRVDEEALISQLEISGCENRRELEYHSMLINGRLPYTIGGGIGQSRICMFFLRKAHIGEVQAALWPEEMIEECEKENILLL
jgi:aspartate--ammonia ligase